ncbi:MAG: 16S rRNA (guanine(966)-N(2))-methyltransferase RsmD [Syntrophaceae bacterium]|jgi:16S rRNA (guanine966-N2)-methyltransferase|nr:16S rRNA (guanine(966)-N(2))-methyltransferase RsmD [Syntrophaceae bacterium]
MRICAGEAKGRLLKFPAGSRQRPTTDFLKEALFNILGSPAGQSFLDLFAGSGSVGLEALSRKAGEAVFVEIRKELYGVIWKNAALCGYLEKCRIVQGDVQSVLQNLNHRKCRFDVIFADPPYNRGFIGRTLKALELNPVLREDGVMVFQHSIREYPSPLPEGWFVADQRKYGENGLTFIRMDKDGGA